MKRGYFDDFKDLKETQGRMFEPSEALLPASASTQLPTIAVRLALHLSYWLCIAFPLKRVCLSASMDTRRLYRKGACLLERYRSCEF